MSGLSAFSLVLPDRARGISLYMSVSHAFMRLFDTTASFVTIDQSPALLPAAIWCTGEGLSKGEQGEELRQGEESAGTAADEIDLFSRRRRKVSMTGGEREGGALEHKTVSRAGKKAAGMIAMLCLFCRHRARK